MSVIKDDDSKIQEETEAERREGYREKEARQYDSNMTVR